MDEEKHFRELGRKVIFLSGSREQRPPLVGPQDMYYPISENKGIDQLRGYREADLRLCFRICRLLVFPRGGSNVWEQLTVPQIYM